jgi:hypothetical protein
MSEPTDEQYFLRVEQHFGRRRGGPLILSPNDWSLLEGWRARGIPLRVVLRGINQAFDRFEASGPRPDRVNSLRYCEQEVQAAWEEHRGARRRPDRDAPSSPGLPAAGEHLGAVAATCRAAAERLDGAPAERLRDAADELAALREQAERGELSAHQIDARCGELEERLRAGLQRSAGADPRIATLRLPPFSPYAAG